MKERIEHWLAVGFRRRRTVIRVGLAFFATVVAVSMLWPPLYESTAAVMVQVNRAQLLVSPGLQGDHATNQPTVVTTPVDEQDLNSEVELLTSPYVIAQALEAEDAAEQPSLTQKAISSVIAAINLPGAAYGLLHGTPDLTPRQLLAKKIARHLTAAVITRSDIIEIGFEGHDPQWCQRLLTRLLEEYMNIHAHISQDPKAQQFFEKQAAILQNKLQLSEEHLSAARLQTGIASLPDQRLALVTQLANFEADYHRNAAQLAAAHEQIRSTESELKTNPQRVYKESKMVQNYALQTLKPQVLELEAERADLISRYRPDSEKIKAIDSKLKAAKSILEHENEREVQETSTDVNPVWETLSANLAQARVTEASLGSTQDALAKQITSYKQGLNALMIDGVAIDRLERQVEADKEVYLSYVRKGEEARAAQALNENKILAVSVAEPPSFPLEPVWPNVEVNIAGGLILALGLGIGAAFWEEHRDSKIYTPAVIADTCGVKTVAMIEHTT
jgi:uncharacterized protein involved in exopolysaccharide biosynthesis